MEDLLICKCGNETFEKQKRGPHLGLFCTQCGKLYGSWVKQEHENDKTDEDYRNEYLLQQPCTEKLYSNVGENKFRLMK